MYGIVPVAGIFTGSAIVNTRSGSPICQPSENCGSAGVSDGLPSFAPPSTHAAIRGNLPVGQPARIAEASVVRVGIPRRHLLARHRLLDRDGPRTRVFI
jgi:hypothetical protein